MRAVLDLSVTAARRASGRPDLQMFHIYGGRDLEKDFFQQVQITVAFHFVE